MSSIGLGVSDFGRNIYGSTVQIRGNNYCTGDTAFACWTEAGSARSAWFEAPALAPRLNRV